MPTAIMAPSMLWLYEFFSVVLLMNLLVALMSDTYARVTAEGELRWQYSRAQLIREYLSQSPLPAPFNVLYYALYSLPRVVIKWYCEKMRGEEWLDDAGFKYIPPQRMLTSLRRAENDAVRKFLATRDEGASKEAATMMESMHTKVEKLGRDNTTKFEAMNQRMDQVRRFGKSALAMEALPCTPDAPRSSQSAPAKLVPSRPPPLHTSCYARWRMSRRVKWTLAAPVGC